MYIVCSRTTNREAKVQSGKRSKSFCSSVRKDLNMYFLFEGPLAQSAEQRTFNPWVVGSIPTGPTNVFSHKWKDLEKT